MNRTYGALAGALILIVAMAFAGCGEEFDLTVRLYARGWAVGHLPDVAFHHHVEKSAEEWRRQV